MIRRILASILILLVSITLIACTPEEVEPGEFAVLPDLNGMVETEIVTFLDGLNIEHTITYHDVQSRTYEHQFIMYDGHDIGDIIPLSESVVVVVYPTYISESIITLPFFDDFTEAEIVSYLTDNEIIYYISYVDTDDSDLLGTFAGYDDNYEAGDSFDNISAVGILIYSSETIIGDEYFQVVDLPYDGPYLDQSLIGTEYLNPRGGAFYAPLLYCGDGDTARFDYPSDVFDEITSGAKSTRFLNMDTEETYTGGEEEWGKPASVYTCELLTSAESIVLQTDPNDGLLGGYGRLLAWIWIQLPGETEYQLLNYMVVRQGLAQVKFEFGAGETLYVGEYTLNEWMHIAEDAAIDENLGQWGNLLDYYWDYDNEQPYYDRWYNAS